MSVLPLRPSRTGHPAPPFLWDRQLRPVIDSMVAGKGTLPRTLLVGNAGSGKSTTLRHLQELLGELGHRVHAVRAGGASLAHVPRDEVLLVDDLHLSDDEQLAELQDRAADPDAALIVAMRPWPASTGSRAIARMVERTAPPIVLGRVGRSDLLHHLEGHGRAVPESCLQHILRMTGGVAWLVGEALAHHDERDCAEDQTHRQLRHALEEQVAHRLDLADPDVRRGVEELCVASVGHAPSADDLVAHGHAEGLLLRSGEPVPVVRSAVRATVTVQRLSELSALIADGLARSAEDGIDDDDPVPLLRDATIGMALAQHGDQLLDTHPARAAELYRGAGRAGVAPALLTARQAQAAWACGDLDTAVVLADGASSHARVADGDRLGNVSAAVWAARGMMAQAHAVYRALPPSGVESRAFAVVAGIGTGAFDHSEVADDRGGAQAPPSTLSISMDLLRRGLAASLSPDRSASALADLVRASELYTSSRSTGAVPELPAVIAAVVSLNMGAMLTAQAVIDDAIRGGHGGRWARSRLLLWRAWVAVQRARPADAREALAHAHDAAPTMSARDALLARAVEVAIARRYEDASGLETAWRRARAALLRTDIDLYLLHPLAELVSSAPRVGDTAHIQPHLTRALEITSALGDPSLWITHLRWAGIQQGILLGQPGLVAPHAKALVAASADDHVAAVMAKAGRVWTSVLGGTVDAETVEAAAEGLASIGLRWDAARLAGHGAGRTKDRKIAARLLACARELHPTDGTRKLAATEADSAAGSTRTGAEEILSDREIEVARLVLQGKTYAEIGDAIFISPRTAEHHIAHIRQRLGATSRSDVLAKLRQLIGDDGPSRTGTRNGTAADASPSPRLRISG